MSIPVELPDLADALEQVGSGYLVSVPLTGPRSGRPKVVTVDPRPELASGGVVRLAAPGRGTLLNVADNPSVTLAMWPTQQHGLSLLVDGTAAAHGDDLLLTPTSAVWHRPADHAAAAGQPVDGEGCGHDCAPVGTPADP